MQSPDLSIEAEYVSCIVHLCVLSLLFGSCRKRYYDSEELQLTLAIFYTLNWCFFLFSVMWYSFVDPLLCLAASYWPGLEAYTTTLIVVRWGWSLAIMLFTTSFIISYSTKNGESALDDPILHTRLWRRGMVLIERAHWFSRPNSLYRRCMDLLSFVGITFPALWYANFLWSLGLPPKFILFLFILWLFYWVALLLGGVFYYQASAPLAERNLRLWQRMHRGNENAEGHFPDQWKDKRS